MPAKAKRPKYLNLFKIHMPVTAIMSILHRVSGVFLMVFTPLSIYALALSVRDAESYAQVQAWLQAWPVRVAVAIAMWSVVHHLLAGIRYLFLDVGYGGDLATATITARAVTYAGAATLVAFAIWVLAG
jgi:succinate dehydrogenase / fumarate reductase cytochrome b subunit